METENKINAGENFEYDKEAFEEALVSESLVVYCDSGIREYLKEDDGERIDGIKKNIDEILRQDWNMGGQKVKAYLFSDKEQYLEYLDKNFPDIPKDMATFDSETNSVFAYSPTDIEGYKNFLGEEILTDEDIENTIRGNIFAGVGHELSHLHPPFNGAGNSEDSGSKWEQGMVCIFIEDKIRSGFDERFNKNIKLQAKEYLKKLQINNKTFSWEEVSNKWDDFTLAERFVYTWLEEKYGLKKLQDLWGKMFKDKKVIADAVKEVYNEDIRVLESNFQKEMLNE